MGKYVLELESGQFRAQPYVKGTRNAGTFDREEDAEDSVDNVLFWARVFGYVKEPELFRPWNFRKESEAIPKTEHTIRILRALEEEKGKPKKDEALYPQGARRIFNELRGIRDTAKSAAQALAKHAGEAKLFCEYIDIQLMRLEDSLISPEEARAREERRLGLELAIEEDKRKEKERAELAKRQLEAVQNVPAPTPKNVHDNPLDELPEILAKDGVA